MDRRNIERPTKNKEPKRYTVRGGLPEYINTKLNMIQDEFCIKLSIDEIRHFRSLKTEEEVDHYAHDIIMKKL